MHDLDIQILAAKILVLEAQLATATDAAAATLSNRWSSLMQALVAGLSRGATSRRSLRVPTKARATLRELESGATTDFEFRDISWNGFRVRGDVSSIRLGAVPELVEVVHDGVTYAVNTPCRVRWASGTGPREGEAGFALNGPFDQGIRALYTAAFTGYLGSLAAHGPSVA